MKILLVCDQFSPEGANHCYGLATSFVKMKNEVIILSSKHIRKGKMGPDHEEISGIEVIRMPSTFIDRVSWVYTPSAPSRIAEVVRDYNIELVNAMHLVHHSTFTSVYAKIPKRVPLILSVLGTRENMGSTFLNFVTRIFEHTFGKIALMKSGGLIADCLETKKSITRLGCPSEKIKVIYEGVDTSKFFPIISPAGSNYNITFLGGLRIQKGVYDLMLAASQIKKGIPNAKISYVGDGPERGRLKEMRSKLGLTENDIIFMGAQPRDRVSEILRNTNCFVLPSWSEGISMALLEAAASALPIVTTKVGGTAELFKNEKNALLVDPRSPQRLAESIIWLSRNPEKAREIGSAARTMAEKLDWMNIAQQTIQYYNTILSGTRYY